MLLGTVFSLALALSAFKGGALSISGTIAAILMGATVYWFGGWAWFILLAVFFLSSSGLTKYKEAEKEAVSREFAKPGPRDVFQVLANGALASLVAVGQYFYPMDGWFVIFAGIIASVNADTWATELGILSKSKPRLLVGWKQVEVGTSGAVSPAGTFYAFGGSFFIALCAAALLAFGNGSVEIGIRGAAALLAAVAFGGLAGALADSLLGALVQSMYWCPKCRKETERTVHKCGCVTQHRRGLKWFDNDVVNLVSSLVGGVVSVALFTAIA